MNVPDPNFKNSPDRARTEFFSYSSSSPFRVATNFGRVVALASFCREIRETRIAGDLAKALHDVTGASVLVVDLTRRDTAISLSDWVFSPGNVGNQFAFSYRLQSEETGFQRMAIRVTGSHAESENFSAMLAHFCRHFRYVLISVEHDVAAAALVDTAIQADLTYLFLSQTPESFYDYSLFVREIRSQRRGENTQLRPVVYLQEKEAMVLSASLEAEVVAAHLKDSVNDNFHYLQSKPAVYLAQIRSLAREIGRCRIGLALSSGGAKGLAHVGVIQVLEQNGIEVDVVAGCSMGSYVGAVWSYGFDGLAMERLAREVEKRWGLLRLMDPVLIPWQGLMAGQNVKRRIMESIGNVEFPNLVRTLRIVATNLHTLERVVFSRGSVADAVHASVAIPGVCVPVRNHGEYFVDGGIVDPLPVDVLKEMGVEKIIAVNTIPTPDYLRVSVQLQKEQAAAMQESRRRLSKWLYTTFDFFTQGSIFKNLLRSINAAQMRIAEESSRRADVVIRPVITHAKWHDFTHPGKFISIGRESAEEHLGALKSLVRGKNHDTQPPQQSVAAVG